MKLSPEKYLEIAITAARDAGDALNARDENWQQVNANQGKDVKLEADLNAESIILKHLGKTDVQVLSEEAGWVNTNEDDGAWVVDPLDGTYNYLRGFPVSCVSIAMVRGNKRILGVIYDFNRDEMFAGIVGVGATLNGNEMTVSNISKKSDAVLMTGFPVRRDFSPEAMTEFANDLGEWKKVRMIGSAALALAYVAAGRADYYREENTMPWDVAAGCALIEAADGSVEMNGNIKDGPVNVSAANEMLLAG